MIWLALQMRQGEPGKYSMGYGALILVISGLVLVGVSFVLLVRCAQPSDAVSVLGWSGTANHYLEPRAFNAVLRAWQARFGAVPIAADGSTLHFVVTRPPSDLDGARQLAAEQFALCPDIVDQGAGTLEALAADLLNAQQWSLWWD